MLLRTSWISENTPADPGLDLCFSCAPVLTYWSTLRSGARQNFGRNRALRAAVETTLASGGI